MLGTYGDVLIKLGVRGTRERWLRDLSTHDVLQRLIKMAGRLVNGLDSGADRVLRT